jgi:hypothetical protein
MPHSSPPPGYTSMPQYGTGGGMPGAPGPNPYASSASSSTGATPEQPSRRSLRRPQGQNERIPMGAYAKANASPKLSRSHTAPTTADRLHRTGQRVGPSGKEWIKGDEFLDACICTTGCTCRDGHRVLYRSRDDSYGDSDDTNSPRYRSGEIRYILKKDLGRDYGDHSGCKKLESESEGKTSEKDKKQEEKKRKEQFQSFKEDILEALDERLDALKKERLSKAGSVSSPRPPFAGLGPTPFAAMGRDPRAMDPMMTQKLGMNGGMGMMGMNTGGNPYAMGMPGMGKLPPGMQDAMGRGPMHPGQMGGMAFEDEMSMADMEAMNMGISYFANGKRMEPRSMSPGRRKPGPIDVEFYRRSLGTGGRRGRRGPRGGGRQRPRGFESDGFGISRRQPGMSKRGDSGEYTFDDLAGMYNFPCSSLVFIKPTTTQKTNWTTTTTKAARHIFDNRLRREKLPAASPVIAIEQGINRALTRTTTIHIETTDGRNERSEDSMSQTPKTASFSRNPTETKAQSWPQKEKQNKQRHSVLALTSLFACISFMGA